MEDAKSEVRGRARGLLVITRSTASSPARLIASRLRRKGRPGLPPMRAVLTPRTSTGRDVSRGQSASWLTRPAKILGSAVAAGTMRERTGAYAWTDRFGATQGSSCTGAALRVTPGLPLRAGYSRVAFMMRGRQLACWPTSRGRSSGSRRARNLARPMPPRPSDPPSPFR